MNRLFLGLRLLLGLLSRRLLSGRLLLLLLLVNLGLLAGGLLHYGCRRGRGCGLFNRSRTYKNLKLLLESQITRTKPGIQISV